jgi:Carboxypeptidase regulatory-like domain
MGCKKAVVLALFSFACFAVSPLLFGQATATFLGTVTDTTGAVVPGATVTVLSQDTGVSRTSQTDAAGEYRVPFLPVGHYTIQVSYTGFQPAEQKDITLQVDENHVVDFKLTPATVRQEVRVSATPVVVETTNPTLGQVINSQQVAQLPLNGRDFVQLATVAPGTTKETNPNSFFNGGASSEVSIRGSFSLSVGGSRANSTDWLYDGVDNNELTAGGIAILPNIDAIQEFKVLTYNYSAEYGTRGGPTVLVTSKSGANDFHGSLFEFLRNTSLDARSFFAQSREQFNENEFGGSLGGPIKKDKTFFFVDYQGRYLREGVTQVGTVPTALMKTGDFSEPISGTPVGQLYNPYNTQVVNGQVARQPFLCQGGAPSPVSANGVQTVGTPCNVIPSSLINPIAQQMINFYPNPNVAGTLVGDYVAAPAKKLDEGEWDARIDHNFSSKDSLFARFSYDQATEFQPSGLPGFVAQPGGFASTQHLDDHGRNAALSETHIFSPTSINQINLGFNRIFNHILSYGSGSCESRNLGIPGANLGGISCGLVDTSLGSTFWALGDRGFAPFQGGTNIFFIRDSFDAIRSNHDIKFGGEVRFNQLNVKTSAFQDGFWIFTNAWTSSIANIGTVASPFYASTFSGGNIAADFLLGLSDLALHDTTFQGPTTGRRWKLLRPYVQDDWRATPNLTLNLGLGWAFVTPITEVYSRQTNFNFQTGQFLIAGHGGGQSVGLSTYMRALEPRIGLAWSPHGDRKLAIRAGYGIFHDSSWNQGAQGLWENPPYFEESNYTGFFPDACPFATSSCAFQGLSPTGYSISSGFPLLAEPAPSQIVPSTTTNLNATNLNFHPGIIQQFNFNIERQLPADFVLTVGYAGSRSTNLLQGDYNVNLGSPTACGTVPGYTFGCGLSTPWPQWGFIYGIFDNGFSRYDSLQVKAETKGRHGLYALISYTYAKTFDNGLADGLGSTIGALYYPLPNSRQADKGLSQIDLTHNFTGSVVYDLPFGKGKRYGNSWHGAENAVLGNWQVNVIEHVTSGFPLFIYNSGNGSGVNFQWNGLALNRPNRICNGQLSNWTVQEFFNPACFPAAASGELGNSDRTPLFGPNFINTDFSAVKNFPLPLREGTSLQFRAEVFNIFNTPQFAQPNIDLNSPGLGQITATVNNPRLIQFALKLLF